MSQAFQKFSVGRRLATIFFSVMVSACGGGGSPAAESKTQTSLSAANGSSGSGAADHAASSGQPAADGSRTAPQAARFNSPDGIALGADGALYVADAGNQTIRKITSTGVVTTLAGTAGIRGSSDGAGAAAQFSDPSGIAVDRAGNVYVADAGNHTIRRITASGVVTTLAGTAGLPGNADGAGAAASFNRPSGVTVDAAGNLYVADTDNYLVRRITSGGVVSTLAGIRGTRGSADGDASVATLLNPRAITIDGAGNLYVTDAYFIPSPRTIRDLTLVRRISPAGVVNTIAGGFYPEMASHVDGTGSSARLYNSLGIAANAAGELVVGDTGNHAIRSITQAGMVSTPALKSGDGTPVQLGSPRGVAVDGAGSLYLADSGRHVIQKIAPNGVVSTVAGREGEAGSNDGKTAGAQ